MALKVNNMAAVSPSPKVIVALDYSTQEQALRLVEQLSPDRCRLKVGKQLFTREGPALVRRLVDSGFSVFLDLKFHDIPNTAVQACLAAADLGVWMVNVHTSGGRAMLTACAEALAKLHAPKPLLTGVTLLTSLVTKDLQELGWTPPVEQLVLRLANLALDTGLAGVVCSPQEISYLRSRLPADFLLVTPGIRPDQTKQADQRRTLTPKQACQLGADYLVIGRPVTQASDPLAALTAIEAELQSA
jgi:orotidine-5'-phosphate decarboxylase